MLVVLRRTRVGYRGSVCLETVATYVMIKRSVYVYLIRLFLLTKILRGLGTSGSFNSSHVFSTTKYMPSNVIMTSVAHST